MGLMYVDEYLGCIAKAMKGIDDDIESASKFIKKTSDAGGRIWTLGNGGSLSIAQHFAQDLLKLCGVKASSLNCPSIISAYSNDNGFEYSYYAPIARLFSEGDIAVIFSCSGKSRNYIEFVSGFDHNIIPIISIVGTDGGFLKEKSNVSIHIKSDDYQICETGFCVVADLIVKDCHEESA